METARLPISRQEPVRMNLSVIYIAKLESLFSFGSSELPNFDYSRSVCVNFPEYSKVTVPKRVGHVSGL